jgi:hypothetical protein
MRSPQDLASTCFNEIPVDLLYRSQQYNQRLLSGAGD